jgi:hypothetical protein
MKRTCFGGRSMTAASEAPHLSGTEQDRPNNTHLSLYGTGPVKDIKYRVGSGGRRLNGPPFIL